MFMNNRYRDNLVAIIEHFRLSHRPTQNYSHTKWQGTMDIIDPQTHTRR